MIQRPRKRTRDNLKLSLVALELATFREFSDSLVSLGVPEWRAEEIARRQISAFRWRQRRRLPCDGMFGHGVAVGFAKDEGVAPC